MFDVIIIGGGASGLMVGGVAAGRGLNVAIIDKNKMMGRKVRITGKGRCNITNNCERDEFFRNIVVGEKFLMSAFSKFDNRDAIDFFEGLGVRTKIERGERVFPLSDNANEVADALGRFAQKCKIYGGIRAVEVKKVAGLLRDGVPRNDVFEVKLSNGEVLRSKSVIIAAGGSSYPLTGSNGGGYSLAKKLGHTIIPIRPALVPLVTQETWVREVEGLSLRNVGCRFVCDGKVIYQEAVGELLFTDFGVSGPAVLSASLHTEKFPIELFIDLKPALAEDVLDKRILRDFSESLNKDFGNALGGLLPKSFIPVFIKLCGISENKKVNQITAEERGKVVHLLKNIPLTITKTRPIDEAIITMGGVDTREVNPSTMGSKICSGLYFCGEVLNISGYTGGFNLQIAWATGNAVGKSVLNDK